MPWRRGWHWPRQIEKQQDAVTSTNEAVKKATTTAAAAEATARDAAQAATQEKVTLEAKVVDLE
jgi:hypothetical protein